MRKIIPQLCPVLSNRALDRQKNYFRLVIDNFKSPRKIIPGQFVHVRVTSGLDPYFRRAFSIAGYDPEARRLEIIYKVIGVGTGLMGRMKKGDTIDVIGPLGNHFSRPSRKQNIIMAAGGVGLPPLLFWTKQLLESGFDKSRIFFFYGGRTKEDLLERAVIKRLGVNFIPTTDDGSFGHHGLITEAISARLDELNPQSSVWYGCGPEPMLAAVQKIALENGYLGELSLEAPMPCGVGVCLGCIKPLRANPKKYIRVCHDGPVFDIGEVIL